MTFTRIHTPPQRRPDTLTVQALRAPLHPLPDETLLLPGASRVDQATP